MRDVGTILREHGSRLAFTQTSGERFRLRIRVQGFAFDDGANLLVEFIDIKRGPLDRVGAAS